jgi:Xaa-Pro dipeptidase
MSLEALYVAHVERVVADTEAALERSKAAGAAFDGVVFHAGGELLVHRDDQTHVFRPDFHFARWAPLAGPDHMIVFTSGRRPRLVRVVPKDFWYESPPPPPVDIERVLDVTVVEDIDAAVEAVGRLPRHAFVGADGEVAEALGMKPGAQEPEALMASLDWSRGTKTDYEVECLRRAGSRAARGHRAVREGVTAGRSERQMLHDYLAATSMVEDEVPYPAIIGWDDHAAVLHYTRKDVTPPAPGGVLLIDAGATFQGYASDVTRTYVTDKAPRPFHELLDGMDDLQRELVDGVGPGVPYVDLHRRAHEGVARLLADAGVLRCSAEEAIEQRLSLPFLPHGLGHHLGLQVHDVGGRQADPSGTVVDPPEDFPALRTTRTLEPGHVVTIEPGLYFVPLLLDPLREEERGAHVDWDLVDALVPYGGIRIEDDVLVTEDGREDLTRPLIPGHRD